MPQIRCCCRFILMKLMKFGGVMRKHEVRDTFSDEDLLVHLGKSRVRSARASARTLHADTRAGQTDYGSQL